MGIATPPNSFDGPLQSVSLPPLVRISVRVDLHVAAANEKSSRSGYPQTTLRTKKISAQWD